MRSETGCWESVFCIFAQKRPLSSCFCFLGLSRICRIFSPKSGFSSKKGPFFIPIGRGCCFMSKNSPLLQPRKCSMHAICPPKHVTTARLKMSCTCEGCFKSLWCPHSCHWIITEVKTPYCLTSGHLTPSGHPSRAGLSRTGDTEGRF